MALAETTLAAAVTELDKSVTLASATSVAANRLIRVGDEVMKVTTAYVTGETETPVLRGQDGTKAQAHPSGARVTHGDAADYSAPATGTHTTFPIAGRARETKTYSASGAITMPKPGNDMLAILNGTSVLAMTLANPTKDMDGCVLTVAGNGVAAHTVTYTGGFGGAGSSYDVLTQNASAPAGFSLIAINELWYLYPAVTGTLTNNAWALT